MPKNKIIDVRPKKRKHSQKSDESLLPDSKDKSRRTTEHIPHFSNDKPRLARLKNRGHGEKHFNFELPFGRTIQKWLFTGSLVVVAIAVLVLFLLHYYKSWSQAQLVNSPLSLTRVISEDALSNELFWGTYRPGLYFGLKHRSPDSLMIGLIWAIQDSQNPRFLHLCDSNDGVLNYNWLEHDGRHFGTQQIVDLQHVITVSFVKQPTGLVGGDWTFRISVSPRNRTHPTPPLFVVVYYYYPNSNGHYSFVPIVDGDAVIGIRGHTAHLGDHHIFFHPNKEALQVSSLMTWVPSEEQILNTMMAGLGVRRDTGLMTLIGTLKEVKKDTIANAWFHEITVDPHTSANPWDSIQPDMTVIEVEFSQTGQSNGLTGVKFDERLKMLSLNFHRRYAERFPVDLNKFTERQVNLSKIAVSNLLGGLGYFHGTSLIRSDITGPDPVSSWPSSLFTATPSRSMFPRGFLWDEGFHSLILTRWDSELAMDTIGYWLDLMNGEGWIPREQILGLEARSRVPTEFLVQHNTVANPPALVLAVEALLDAMPDFSAEEAERFRHWSALVLPRLHAWYQWFNRTQSGPLPLSYRWRGRDPKETRQLNPLTLSSGLDDFPRASHPSNTERHLDLRCWMAFFARIVSRLASFVAQCLQTDDGPSRLQKLEQTRSLSATYSRWADLLFDLNSLDRLHWSGSSNRYADYGFHSDAVRLQQPERNTKQSPFEPEEPAEPVRHTDKAPTPQLVTSAFGYVNLFPLLLRIVPPNSHRLSQLLSSVASPDLWTEFGLRSLSNTSLWYRKSNTRNDPPYWRGAIWLNINYLAVHSLRYYGKHPRTPTDLAVEANRLATSLSQNLARMVLGELERTGFLWEQYDDITGHGQRAHPFSGWTSLVSLLMVQ
ncbi:unnamed protein product [Dicrocoelium dendriticum]|nr:unnamed protein product [Dicrocoelium dendriticum]